MGFGQPKTAKPKPSYTGIQLTTSSSTLPIALAGGLTRLAPNLLDYTDFASHSHKVKTGKGFGSQGSETFTYSATPLMALCAGEIAGVGQAWKDKGTTADYSSFGFTLFTGTVPQAPWGYMVGAHADKARGYPGVAYLAAANFDFGDTPTLSNFSFEVKALLFDTQVDGAGDADPALWLQLYLTDPDKGAGFLGGLLDLTALLSGPDAGTTGDGACQTYCRAMGFGISPCYVEQEPASAATARVATIISCATAWTGDRLKFIPFGDTGVVGHGVTYVPPTGVCYDLGDDDYYQPDGDNPPDPVRVSRSDPADAKNCINLIIRDRANAYNEVPVPYQDDNAVALYGRKPAQDLSGREVCDAAMAGRMIALAGARILYSRNTYTFPLPPRFDRLEPMDVVTLNDSKLGLVAAPVRILEINEDENDILNVVAEQFTGALGSVTDAAAGSGVTPGGVNSLDPPGPVNAPVLFEPSAALAQRLFGSSAACIVAAVSGGANWGGAVVWLSTDGATYTQIGQVNGPARMGVSTAILAAYGGANPDTVHALSVDLSMSAAELNGVTSADAAAGATLAWVDGEVLSYRDATLTAPHAYDLGGELYRGQYGATAGAHAIGSAFARLDGAVFKDDLIGAYIGVTLSLKFQSFNIWGQAHEDLAGCAVYTITPTGAGFAGSSSGTGAPTPASVDIPANHLVNIWDDAGVAKLRLADASSGIEAHGFVTEAVASGATGIPRFSGEISQAGLTPGLAVFLGEDGQLTHTPDFATSGALQQQVGLATGPSTADFLRGVANPNP